MLPTLNKASLHRNVHVCDVLKLFILSAVVFMFANKVSVNGAIHLRRFCQILLGNSPRSRLYLAMAFLMRNFHSLKQVGLVARRCCSCKAHSVLLDTQKTAFMFQKRLCRNYASQTSSSQTPINILQKVETSIETDSGTLATSASDLAANVMSNASVNGSWEYVISSSILWPSNLLERAMELVHHYSGLPWSGTLVLYTIALRILLFPLSLKQTRSTIMANNLKPQVQKLQSDAQSLREQGRIEDSRSKLRELAHFMSKNDINPAKILGVSLVPLPFFMATFFAIRNIANQPIASLLDEGALWFTNLTIADPYYILPAVSTITLLLSMEVSCIFS